MSAWQLALALIAAGSAPAQEPDHEGLPEKVALRCELLAMGPGGTRPLAQRRLVLQPGMAGTLRFQLPPGAGGRDLPVTVAVQLETAAGEDGLLRLDVAGEVREEVASGEGGVWRSGRQLALGMGTSALVEMAPPAQGERRLALSLTAEGAAGETVKVPLSRVDLDVEVAAVDGDTVAVLEHPLLRSLTNQPVRFSVDYQVPAVAAGGFESVRLELELKPGFPRGDRLPLEVSLAGDFPAAGAPVLTRRSDSRLLRPGEVWEMALRPPANQGPWVRVRIMVLWQKEPRDDDRRHR